jgi:hypothetical protein
MILVHRQLTLASLQQRVHFKAKLGTLHWRFYRCWRQEHHLLLLNKFVLQTHALLTAALDELKVVQHIITLIRQLANYADAFLLPNL